MRLTIPVCNSENRGTDSHSGRQSTGLATTGFLVRLLDNLLGHLLPRDLGITVCEVGLDLRHSLSP